MKLALFKPHLVHEVTPVFCKKHQGGSEPGARGGGERAHHIGSTMCGAAFVQELEIPRGIFREEILQYDLGLRGAAGLFSALNGQFEAGIEMGCHAAHICGFYQTRKLIDGTGVACVLSKRRATPKNQVPEEAKKKG
jgi:hypothetical protein